MINDKKVFGFICEVNPFHDGHKKILNIAKNEYKADYIIAIMSGNFVQRGELSVYDKYERTKKLLENDVDVVIELPVEYVLSSAKYFSSCSIEILNKIGFVDNLIFGSNINDINVLTKISNQINKCIENYNKNIDDEINNIINNELKNGNSYSKALSIAFNTNLTPNDILGIEYISSLIKSNSNIKPVCIERNSELLGASEIRNQMTNKPNNNMLGDYLNQILFYNYYNNINLTNYYDIDEDFSNALYNISLNNMSFDERVDFLNKKNRTKANVKRNLLHILLNIKQDDMIKNRINYIRILGFKKSSEDILKYISFPFITSYSPQSVKSFNNKYFDITNDISYKINLYASNLYQYVTKSNVNEYNAKTVIVKLKKN